MGSLGDLRGLWWDVVAPERYLEDPDIWARRKGSASFPGWHWRGRVVVQMLEAAQTGGRGKGGSQGRCTDGYLSDRKCPKLQRGWEAEHSCAHFPVAGVPWESFREEEMVSQPTPDPARASFLPHRGVRPVCVCACVTETGG